MNNMATLDAKKYRAHLKQIKSISGLDPEERLRFNLTKVQLVDNSWPEWFRRSWTIGENRKQTIKALKNIFNDVEMFITKSIKDLRSLRQNSIIRGDAASDSYTDFLMRMNNLGKAIECMSSTKLKGLHALKQTYDADKDTKFDIDILIGRIPELVGPIKKIYNERVNFIKDTQTSKTGTESKTENKAETTSIVGMKEGEEGKGKELEGGENTSPKLSKDSVQKQQQQQQRHQQHGSKKSKKQSKP